ncbi:MAG TPA: pyridoxal phosphate-dependent aminotransferase [Candidatus Dormibacteraeota bacterium]|nr:pyridoxal phosphate-dependent aminotransferase [Candidatus Dormibacteraeota bacterium]
MTLRSIFAARTNWTLEENAYAQALRRHQQSGRALLDLTASNPTTCGFTYNETAILDALRSPAALRYDPQPKGLPSAREAVARYYEEIAPGAALDPERLILTTGTSEAYSFLFRLLCEPGDEVLVAHPSYPLFDFLASIQDVKLRPFHLIYDHSWQIDFHELENCIGAWTRAILLVHPNNPTGNFVRQREAEQLNALCAAHHLALVVDEVFLDYRLASETAQVPAHGSFVSNSAALTFVLSGLSKISALPQIKLGWIAASGPQELVRDAIARLEVIADTYLSLNAPVQHALPVLLAQRQTIQRQLLSRVEANLRHLDEHVAGQTLVSRLEIEGGWYAVLRVPAVRSDEEIAIALLDDSSVAVHPGHFYEFPGEGYLVLSLLTPIDQFKEGVRRLVAQVAKG